MRTMVRGAQWRALRPLLRGATGLVAVCQFEVEVFARRLGVEPERIRLIRNGAEPLPVGDCATRGSRVRRWCARWPDSSGTRGIIA